MNSTQTAAKAKSSKVVGTSRLTDEYVTPEELAQELGTSLRTLARWHTLRIGPPRTAIGRTILYRRESVTDWLRKREDRSRRSHT